MQEDTHIRAAEFRDAENIFNLIKKHPRELLARPVSDIVQNIDRFLVYDNDGQLVGTVSWQILPEMGAPRNPSIEISSLAVETHAHGLGIGSKLVAAALNRVTMLHPSQIIVLTFTPGFFAKLGFREVSKDTIMHRIYMGCMNCTKYDSPFTCPEVAMVLGLPDAPT